MNNWTSGLIGIGIGFLFTVIMFNVSAANAVKLDPQVTMNSYWFGK